MRSGRNLLIVLAAITCCVVVIWLSGSIEGSQKTYEIRPTIRLPGYDPWDASGRTDAARALGAYERLMDHYIDLTEENLFSIDAEIRNVADKLEIIDARLARIESALGVKHPLMRSTAAEPNGPHTAAPHGNTA
ncbi:MAG: hypothetical protein JSU70_05810, partial [Phycisphaerales bacterium]